MELEATWAKLESQFGPIEEVAGFHVVQIETRSFLIRAPKCGNPITVIRKSDVVEADQKVLHEIVAFCNDK